MADVMLLSNSTMPGAPFFSWAKPWVSRFLGPAGDELVFIPFAAVSFSFDEYEEKVAEAFGTLGFRIRSIHRFADYRRALDNAGGIVAGGGNSFALLARMYQADLLDIVREKVDGGCPYVGWSAGANLACPTIMTTNDMPVVQCPSLGGLGLVPFQINPHYHELRFEGQGGETRRERLEEFLAMNPHVKVLGLPEGTLVQRNGGHLVLQGTGAARLYSYGQAVRDIRPGDDVSFLLEA